MYGDVPIFSNYGIGNFLELSDGDTIPDDATAAGAAVDTDHWVGGGNVPAAVAIDLGICTAAAPAKGGSVGAFYAQLARRPKLAPVRPPRHRSPSRSPNQS